MFKPSRSWSERELRLLNQNLDSPDRGNEEPVAATEAAIPDPIDRIASVITSPAAQKAAREFLEGLRDKEVQRAVLERIADIRSGTLQSMATAAEVPETPVQKAIREMREKAEKDPAAFHREITLTPENERAMTHAEGAEVHGKHWMRLRLSPNKRPKPLIIIINGNNNPLTDARPRPAGEPQLPANAAPGAKPSWATDPRGTPEEQRTWWEFPQGIKRGNTHVADRIAAEQNENFDVVQLRVGNICTTDPRLSTEYAKQMAKTVIRQALAGQGAFDGREYTEVRILGQSHGAGLTRVLSEEWADMQPKGRTVPITRTAYYDGITYGQTGALTRRPVGSGRHLQVYQPNRVGLVPVAGAPLAGGELGPQDENVLISRERFPGITGDIDHRTTNNGRNPGMTAIHDLEFDFLTRPDTAAEKLQADLARTNRFVRDSGQFGATGR